MYWMDGMEGGGRSTHSTHPENLHLHKSKGLSVDREGQSLVPIVCGLEVMHGIAA